MAKKNYGVYDIEVEDCHNFFANDILVHNSDYFDLSHVVDTMIKHKKIKNDNDSIADFLNDFANRKIQPVIKQNCETVAKKMCATNYMNMSREAICETGFWTGKKHYALSVIDNEGVRYKEPKLKVTGIEIVRSSTPASVKPFLRKVLIMILRKEDISKYVKDCKKEYLKFEPEQMAFPRGANNFSKWYQEKGIKKGTPIGVKSSFIYNRYIDDKNLESKFAKIQSGDKIKFLYLNQPNILNQEVVGFLRRLPEELKKYVDIEKMWYKSFYSIIESICGKIDVEHEEKRHDINQLF